MKSTISARLARGKSALIGSLLLILIPSLASGKNFFSWDADSTSTSLGDCRSFIGSIDTTQKFTGNASLKLVVPGDKQGHIGCEPGNNNLGSGVDGGWLYYRWWMKIDSKFSWHGTQRSMKSNRVKRLGDIPPPIFTLFLEHDKVSASECHECNFEAQIFYDFSPVTNPAVADWQEYIIGIKKQTGDSGKDGEFHFWVNDKEIGNGVRGVHYFNGGSEWVEGWGANMVRPYPQLNGTSDDGGIIWIDDVSLDNAWNSIFPEVADKTPPQPPKGLSIQ